VVSILVVTVHGLCIDLSATSNPRIYGMTIFHLSCSIRFSTIYGMTDIPHNYINRQQRHSQYHAGLTQAQPK